MNTEEMQQLAAQLRQPSGTNGITVSEMMHETNISMTRHAVGSLHLSDQEQILELGHGNAAHLPYILEQAKDLHYTGLELSELMHTEALRINRDLLKAATFTLYGGGRFPLPENFFDKAFTVNTIYFWPVPLDTLNELYRVLKAGGLLCITYGEAAFMKNLPFTQYGFTLYSRESLSTLIGQTGFQITGTQSQTEYIKSKTGEMIERTFTTITMQK